MAHPKDDRRPLWERDPERYREKTKQRILAKVVTDPETGCWVWTAAVRGHGSRRDIPRPHLNPYKGRKSLNAYRVAYEVWVGPIPDGLGIDHSCENKLCVNPDHLEPVTTQENTRRYWERQRAKRKQALIDAGHPAFRNAGAR